MKIKIYQINGDRDKNRVKFTRHDLLQKYQGTSEIDAYNPFEDTLRLEYTVTTATAYEDGDYEPTEDEAKLIKEMITERIRDEYGQTPQEFCLSVTEDMGMGGIT